MLVDFSKAFDSVDRLALVEKLKTYNIADNIVDGVVSLLIDSDQYTKVGDKRLFTRVINRSVVQSSGIDPTLFITYQ